MSDGLFSAWNQMRAAIEEIKPMPGMAVASGKQAATASPAVPSQVREFALQQSRNLFVEILVMLASSVVCIVLYFGGDADAANYLAPATVLVVGGIANIHMVRQDPNTLLTPLFATRLIALVVFGIGALSHNWLSAIAQSSADYMMVTSPEEAARVNMLWLGGMDVILIGVLASLQLFSGMQLRPKIFATHFSFNTALALVLFGFVPVFLILTSHTLPNLIANLFLALQLSGMFLMARISSNKISAYIWISLSIGALIMLSLFFMNKTIVLYPVLALVLGFISIKASFTRIALGSVTVLGLFIFIAPIVTQLRENHVEQHGSLGDISVGEQIEAISAQDFLHREQTEQPNSANSRLDYVVPAAFAMNQYDSGFKIDTIENSAAALVPRFLWPDKPVLTTGDQVNHRMGFQGTNSIGVTVFADIYWNLGWVGLILGFGMGIYTGLITIVSRELMRMDDWFMLPFVMAAFRMGVSLDGEFVASMLVPAVLNLVIFFGLRIVGNFLSHRV
jgi:hypothetical protein